VVGGGGGGAAVVVVVGGGGGADVVFGVATGAFGWSATGCATTRVAAVCVAGGGESRTCLATRFRLGGSAGACTTVGLPAPVESATPCVPVGPARSRGMSVAPATAAASSNAAIPRSIPLMSPAFRADNIPRTGHRQEGSWT
jgi:hypothetical protein